MGLLSNIFGSDTEGVGGLLSNIGSALHDNSGLLLGYGAGGAEGMLRGSQLDQQRRLVSKKQADEAKRKEALGLAAKQLGVDPNIAEALPDVLSTVAARKYAPKEYGIEETYLRNLQKADPDKFNTLMESKYAPKSDLPGDVKEYQYDMIQRRQMGGQLVPYAEWKLQKNGNENKVLAGDRKIIYGAEDDNLNLDATISTLSEAEKLNTQTHTGWGAAGKGRLGTSGLPGTELFLDPAKSKATAEFGKIMSQEAIKTMADTLKGATTDFELNKFVEILADPETPPEIRGRTIQRMKVLAERKRQLNNERINQLSGGTYFKNRAQQGGGQPSAPNGVGKTKSGINFSVE